jgi:hypothetical protein
MGETLSFHIPLVDEQGQSKGRMYLHFQKRPRDLPRAGESVVVGGVGLDITVKKVSHSGFFSRATLHFEPQLYSWRSKLEENDKNWKYTESD